MTLDFLAVHDALLAQGAAGFGPEFRRLQASAVMSFQCPDGGFRGRMGGSDPYYTDFACRTLSLLGASPKAIFAAANFALTRGHTAQSVVDFFCILNVTRMAGRLDASADSAFRESLSRRSAGAGARAGESQTYDAFLECLCRGILGEDIDAGVLDSLPPSNQTSSTAARAGILLMAGTLTDDDAENICTFLTSMQSADGGFLAHPAAPHGDLLSTYTAYVTLAMLGGEHDVDAVALARFLKETALPEGGFRSCAMDPETDVEYTFYGVATLALLRAAAA